MRCLLYRPSWQSLRVSLLKENRLDGGWTTVAGTEANIVQLERYVSGYTSEYRQTMIDESRAMGYGTEHEECARLYRVINCLNAVRMGNSGQGLKGSSQDKSVLGARDYFQGMQTINYHRHLSFAAKRWDWGVVKRELQWMRFSPDSEAVYKSLAERIRKSPSMGDRPELATFMQLMEEVRAQ